MGERVRLWRFGLIAGVNLLILRERKGLRLRLAVVVVIDREVPGALCGYDVVG